MKTTLAILLLGLILATCLIAYLADMLGKNLGKKRVSLFGLRPRTTATIISMATSVGIMLFTVVFLMATSQSLSNALLKYDELKAQANRDKENAEKQTAQLNQEISSQRRAIANSDKRLASTRKSLVTTARQLETTRSRFAKAQAERNEAERNAALARRSAQNALARYRTTQRSFNTVRAQLHTARIQVEQARLLQLAAQQRVQEANRRYAGVQKSLAASSRQLQSARDQVVSARQRLNETNSQLREVETSLRKIEEQFNVVQGELNKNIAELAKVKTELAESKVLFNQLRDTSWQISTGAVSFHNGDIFSKQTIEPGKSVSEIRDILQEMVDVTSKVLSSADKKVELSDLPLRIGDRIVSVRSSDIIRHLSEYLSGLNIPVSVRLAAARDHASSENTIKANFLLVPVRTIYNEGDTLAEANINAPTDARIFNQLRTLMDAGETAARSRNASPIVPADSPYFFAAGTNEEIFGTLRRVQAMDGKAHVKLVAARDLNTIEPLQVRFEVSPLE